jgi:hypothetical protein
MDTFENITRVILKPIQLRSSPARHYSGGKENFESSFAVSMKGSRRANKNGAKGAICILYPVRLMVVRYIPGR